jgi:hypothetical protein
MNIRDSYRGINEIKKGYQPKNNLVKEKNGDLFADFRNNWNGWKNYFSQLLMLGSIHTAEPLVPGPSRLEVEIAIAKLKKV